MSVQVKDAKRIVHEYVQKSAHDAGGELDLQALAAGMAVFSEGELRLTILMEGNTKGDLWPIAIALSRGEIERREAEDAKRLAYRTTILSAIIGAVGAIVGTGFGAWLAN